MKRYTVAAVREIADAEGLGFAVENYCVDPIWIEDAELKAAWRRAADALASLRAILEREAERS